MFNKIAQKTWTDEITTGMIKHKWDKIGPSYLFSKNGDYKVVMDRTMIVYDCA